MAGHALKSEIVDTIVNLSSQGLNYSQIANQLKLDRSTVKKHLKKRGIVQTVDDEPTPELSRKFQENEDVASVVFNTDKPIKTLDEAMEEAQVDTDVWYPERFEVTDWTVGMKVGEKGNEQVIRSQQYRVKVYFKRIAKRSILEAVNAIYDRLASKAPKLPKPPLKLKSSDEYMGVFALFDVHFGKLAWAAETGKNFDLKIADTIFRDAVVKLVDQSKHRSLAYAVMPLGNDFFHFDSINKTTTAGTPQDTDGRYSKVIATGELAFIWAIEQLAAICPVHVPVVPGNHDYHSSFHLARTVNAYFRNCKHVHVDLEPAPRKYVRWKSTLIGLTHGDKIAPDKLPNVMATERPQDWAETTCHEWLIGHGHRSRKWVTKPVDTHDGATVRMLQSLSGTDFWHYANGYIGTRQAAEVYWYSKRSGYAGHAIADAVKGVGE